MNGFRKWFEDIAPSILPKSLDGPAAGKRKPGGQPGHPGRCRNLVPIEQVKQVIRMLPDSCKRCKRKFTEREKQAALQNNVHRHQVAEIPEMKAETTEYQFGSVVCCCGESAADSC